jgi:hypothetical protein
MSKHSGTFGLLYVTLVLGTLGFVVIQMKRFAQHLRPCGIAIAARALSFSLKLLNLTTQLKRFSMNNTIDSTNDAAVYAGDDLTTI